MRKPTCKHRRKYSPTVKGLVVGFIRFLEMKFWTDSRYIQS